MGSERPYLRIGNPDKTDLARVVVLREGFEPTGYGTDRAERGRRQAPALSSHNRALS
ncbi:hypothetical protein GCM10009525_57120 [Streptosporangium amethystogenes subsp. fukuiense]